MTLLAVFRHQLIYAVGHGLEVVVVRPAPVETPADIPLPSGSDDDDNRSVVLDDNLDWTGGFMVAPTFRLR
jgi:hypothetical protein